MNTRASNLREKILILLDQYSDAALIDARLEMLNRLNGSPPKISKGAYKAHSKVGNVDQDRKVEVALAFVKKNPRKTIVEIAEAVGVEVQTLKPAFKRLREQKKVKTQGKLRGTRYIAV